MVKSHFVVISKSYFLFYLFIIFFSCNKLFRTQLEVEYHAAKTGHANFSQSTEEKKPLTEEEKKAQLQLLEEKIKLKKKEKEEIEKTEELEREKNRIKSGKEIVAIRKK